MEVHVEKCETLKVELANFTTELNDLIKKIDSIPTEIINITEITGQLSTKEKEIANLIAHNIQLNEELFNNKEVLVKITNFVSEFDVTEVQKNKDILIEKQERLNQLVADIKNEEIRLQNQHKKTQLLKEVPCGSLSFLIVNL